MSFKLTNALSEWLLDCTIRGFSPRTVKSYRNNMERLINWVAANHDITDVDELTAPAIKSFLLCLQQQGVKGTYINSLIKTYRAFFVYLDSEYDIHNPMGKIKWSREITPIITTFSDEEVKNLIAYYNKRDFLSVRNKTIIVKRYIEQVGSAENVSVVRDGKTIGFDELEVADEE